MKQKFVKSSDFKAQCLTLLDTVGPEGLTITKRGKPVARLIPIPVASADLLGCLRGSIQIHGDIMSTGEAWNAES